MLTKMVDGQVVEMSEDEETAIRAAWATNDDLRANVPPPPDPLEVRLRAFEEVLRDKRVITKKEVDDKTVELGGKAATVQDTLDSLVVPG